MLTRSDLEKQNEIEAKLDNLFIGYLNLGRRAGWIRAAGQPAGAGSGGAADSRAAAAVSGTDCLVSGRTGGADPGSLYISGAGGGSRPLDATALQPQR